MESKLVNDLKVRGYQTPGGLYMLLSEIPNKTIFIPADPSKQASFGTGIFIKDDDNNATFVRLNLQNIANLKESANLNATTLTLNSIGISEGLFFKDIEVKVFNSAS